MTAQQSAPLVGVVMGSSSDWEVMRHAVDMLTQFGIPFEARLQQRVRAEGREAMIVEIEGAAFITSTQTIFFEKGDPLSQGFLCR